MRNRLWTVLSLVVWSLLSVWLPIGAPKRPRVVFEREWQRAMTANLKSNALFAYPFQADPKRLRMIGVLQIVMGFALWGLSAWLG